MKIAIALSAVVFFSLAACNGKTPYTSVTDALTKYPEIELSTFSVSGTAVCDWCLREKKTVEALQIEIVPADEPLTNLATNVFEGLGPFSFSDLRHKKGVKLTVYGRLYFGTEGGSRAASAEIIVPESDGETVSFVMNF